VTEKLDKSDLKIQQMPANFWEILF
jgi:hypothetical protein